MSGERNEREEREERGAPDESARLARPTPAVVTTVLVVDDSEVKRYVVARYLRAAGFGVEEAATGREALDRARRADLILLDVRLPDIHGFEVARRLKADPATAGVPILHLSVANADAEEHLLGVQSGADAYLTEPVEPAEVLSTVRALLKLRATESELRRKQAELEAVLSSIPDVVVFLDGERQIQWVNRAFTVRLGYRGDEVRGRPMSMLLPDSAAFDAQAVAHYDPRSDAPAEPYPIMLRRQDGTLVEAEAISSIVYGETGGVLGYLDIVRDVSERRRAERALAHQSEVTRVLAENATSALFMTDAEGRATYMNRAAQEMTGLTLEELQQAPVDDVLLRGRRRRAQPRDAAPDDPAERRRAERRAPRTSLDLVGQAIREGRRIVQREAVLLRRSGAPFPVVASVSPILGAGAVVGAVLEVRDVTVERRAASRLTEAVHEAREANREAQSANKAKTEFLAVMSHELRTPLNAIGGYADLMALGIHGPITAEQAASLARIQANQRHLLGLISDILSFAKIGAGHVHYTVTDVSVAELFREVEAVMQPLVAKHGLRLEVQACDLPPIVHADRDRTRQVLLNLLTNAVKFTAAGGVVTLDCDERDGVVSVRVTDTGVGIAPDHLGRIFDPFVQVNSSLTRSTEGVGLGLAISRDLARAMGGDLVAESTPGVGSRFTLTLPRA